MSEVEVSIGTNLSPLKRGLAEASAQVKSFAKQAQESAGIESGDVRGYRNEERQKRGLESIIRSVANAKSPIDALSGSIEGIERSFRLAGSGLFAFAIGDFLRDQLEKAAEAAQEFYGKTDKIFEVGKDSSREFAQDAVKGFEEAEKAYGEEGFLTKLIYGKGQQQTLERARATVEQVKQMLAEANAAIIRDHTAAETSRDPLEKANAEKALLADEYKKKIDDSKSPEEKAALQEQSAAKIAQIDQKYQDEELARLTKIDDVQKEIDAEAEKQNGIGSQQKKLDELSAKIKAEQEALEAQKNAPISVGSVADYDAAALSQKERELALEKDLTAQKELQASIAKTDAEAQKKNADGVEANTKRLVEQFERAKEKAAEVAAVQKKEGEAKVDQQNALAELSIYHGQTSSLRKIGLGGTAKQDNTEQLKKLTDANKRLDDIKTELSKLNSNLQST